jgi:diguanylate cyclase (GGDEF)-like protein/PAS domain S-box-containing protein
MVVGIGLPVAACLLMHHREYLGMELAFQQEAAERYDSLKREIEFDLQAVEAITAFYQASAEVERHAFRSFVTPLLDRHPSIQALEWIPRVSLAERDTYERKARGEGFPGFQITEKKANGPMRRVRIHSEYFPVYFVEPYRGNEAALGFDLSSNPTRDASLSLARDTGRITATPRISLVQETANQPGFIVFAPVYRKAASLDSRESRQQNLAGFALGVFRIGEIVEHSLAHLTNKPIDMVLYDQSGPKNDRVLYSNRTTPSQLGNDSSLGLITYARSIDVAGRVWTVVLTPTRAYLSARGSWHPWAALILGLMITVLLARYLFISIGRARHVERLVEARTGELAQANTNLENEIAEKRRVEEALRKSEALFRAVVEKSSEVLLLTDAEGEILYVSPSVTEGFGYDPSDVIGKEVRAFVHVEDLSLISEAVSWVRQTPGRSKNLTVRVRHEDGSWRWVEITIRNLLSEPGVGAVVANMRDITDRRTAQDALEESENKFKDLVEKAIVGVYLVQDGVFRYANSKCAEIHGYADPQEMDGLDIRGTFLPEDLPPVEKTEEWVHGEGQTQSRQFRIVRKDGEVRHVETFGRHTLYRGKQAVIGMIIDITDRKNAGDALLWKTTFLEALVHSSQDGILVLHSRMQKVAQNQRLLELWNMPADVAGAEDPEQCLNFLMASTKNPEEFYKKLIHLYNHPHDTVRGEFELKNGTFVEAFSYPVLGKESVEQYGRIWMFRDITEIRRYWDMLENLSTTDGLTGISNRRRFDEFLEREWRRSMREYSNLSLLIVDIDYFKEFNDRYGHLAGDDCLKQVAATLGGTMRRASDLVARYGGDEFTCVLPGTGEQRAVKVAQRIADEVAGLSIPHESSSVAGHVTVSIGVATEVPEKGREYSDLISRADRCLYAAKDQGRNRVVALLDDYSNKERPDGRRSRSTDRAGT